MLDFKSSTIDGLFSLGQTALEKIWPDPTKRSEEMRKLEALRQEGDIAQLNAYVTLMTKQAEINLADAKSGNFFQAGWRPSIGWVGAISLALMYIPKAIVMTVIWTWQCIVILQTNTNIYQIDIPQFPELGVSDIIGLLMAMLGVGAMRSYDKLKKTDTKK